MLPANEQASIHSQVAAMQGMSLIRRIEIPVGQVLYRFYDSTRARTPSEGANGPWWLEFEYFQAIRHFAQRHDHSFSYSARLFAAILYKWSEVNAYVACQAEAPLIAWKGIGKQVHSKGRDSRDLSTMTPMQGSLQIYQLYVPGVHGEDFAVRDSLHVRSHGVV